MVIFLGVCVSIVTLNILLGQRNIVAVERSWMPLEKMAFDGSIEKIKCITGHEDYDAISNKAVLLQVAPLLRNKDGRGYRRRAGISENE